MSADYKFLVFLSHMQPLLLICLPLAYNDDSLLNCHAVLFKFLLNSLCSIYI